MKKIELGILILSNSWGGAEISIYNLIKHLDRGHFQVYLFVNGYLVKNYSNLAQVRIVNLGVLESNKKVLKIYTLWGIRQALLKTLKKNQVDLLHLNLENSLLIWGMIKGQLNMPIIFTLRGNETKVYHAPQTLEQRLIRWLLNSMLNDKQIRITAVSNWLTKDFSDKARSKIKVIFNGVNCQMFKPNMHDKLIDNQPDGNKIVFYYGRIVSGKGIEDLIAVAKKLPEYEFWFAGKGPLSSIINLTNTRYLGFKEQPQLIKLLSQVTICVFPSLSEGFGLVGLESMACGKAIIATQTGFSDYVDHDQDGLLIESGNRQQLKTAIIRLMEDEISRKRIEIMARKKALKYDFSHTLRNYEILYRKMVIK